MWSQDCFSRSHDTPILRKSCPEILLGYRDHDIPLSKSIRSTPHPNYFPQVDLISFARCPRRSAECSPLHSRGRFHQPPMTLPTARCRQSSISCCAPPHAGSHPFTAKFHDSVPEIEASFASPRAFQLNEEEDHTLFLTHRESLTHFGHPPV